MAVRFATFAVPRQGGIYTIANKWRVAKGLPFVLTALIRRGNAFVAAP